MKKDMTIKRIQDLQYYTALHPEIKALYQAGGRPKEFGTKIWATSLILLDYIQPNPFNMRGLRVLEIGCGWGIIGVYLAKKFECQVTCSDIDPHVFPIVKIQARLNDVSIKTKQASFDKLSSSFLKNFDVIIGSEVCYSEEMAKGINQLIQNAFAANVQRILLADPGRPDFSDCYAYCEQRYKTDLLKLPGSVNGKITQVLSVYNKSV